MEIDTHTLYIYIYIIFHRGYAPAVSMEESNRDNVVID